MISTKADFTYCILPTQQEPYQSTKNKKDNIQKKLRNMVTNWSKQSYRNKIFTHDIIYAETEQQNKIPIFTYKNKLTLKR